MPCTPAGCIELLQRSGVQVRGKEVVVLGRSNIVGMPVAHLLTSMDATVTICHSRTKDLAEHIRRADIVVAAIGRAEMVKGEWLKVRVAPRSMPRRAREAHPTQHGAVRILTESSCPRRGSPAQHLLGSCCQG